MDFTAFLAGASLTAGRIVVLDLNGNIKILAPGQAIAPGELVIETLEETDVPQFRIATDAGETNITDDIQQIFAALEEGQDPTQLGDDFATAAGETGGSSLVAGGTISRTGAESLASTDFSTQGLQALGLSETQSLALANQLRAFNDQITIVEPTPDERPAVSSISSPTVSEGDKATFDVSLSNESTTETTVTLTLAGDSATAGTDFTSTEVTITYQDGTTKTVAVNGDGTFDVAVPAGDTTFSISVQTTDDNIFEGDETFTLSGQTATQTTATTGTATLKDDGSVTPPDGSSGDDRPSVDSISSPTVSEGDKATFDVSLSNASTTATTVTLTLAGDSATAGTDFTSTEVTITYQDGTTQTVAVNGDGTFDVAIPAGDTTFSISVQTTDDNIFEGDETFTLSGQTATQTTATTGTATLKDDGSVTPPDGSSGDDRPSVDSISSPTVSEGDKATFDVSLSNASTTATTVTLTLAGDSATAGTDFTSTEVTITYQDGTTQTVAVNGDGTFDVAIPAGDTTFSISVQTTDDNIFEGDETFTLSGQTATQTTATTGTATLKDDGSVTPPDGSSGDDRPSVDSISSPTVSEGDKATFDVSLSNASTTATTVTLTLAGDSATAGTDFTSTEVTITYQDGSTQTVAVNGDGTFDVTIPAGDTTFSISVQTTDDNVFEGDETFTLSGQTATQETPIAGTATITDTIDDTTVSLSATGSVSEAGGTIVYTATLTNPAEGAVTVKLSNGQTITIADGQTVGTVEVTVDANEDVYKDASSVSASIESATGGNFENLVVDQTPAVTNITDTIDDTTVSLSATGSVSEAGGTIVYTATLTNPAEGAVTVKLSNGQTITIADGQTVGTVEVTVDANEDVYKDASSVSASIESATGGNFENLVVDQTPAVTNITDTIDDTTVSLSATGSVSEAGGTIVYTATLTNPAEGAVTVKLSNGQTITIADGQTVGTVEVTVDANEDVYKDASSVSASIESATGGNFENLVVDQTPAVTNITDTIDDTTVSLSATGSVSEAGGTIVYTATLTNPAEGAVTVKLSNGQTITIADGQTVGTVEVTVDANEDVYKDASSVSASIESATGGNFENLVVDQTPAVTNITDTIDDTTVSLSATGSVSEAGGTIVYTATLTNPAEGAVTVKLSNGQTITIADGQTVGTVEVTVDANEDVYKDASSVSASIESATGGNFENLVVDQTPAVTNITDTIDDTTVSLSATGSVSEAGGTIVYTATLTNPAEGAVTVKLSNGQTITIADGQTVGTVEVTVDANEDVYKDASSVSASIESATGGNFENLVVDQTPAVTNITDTIDDTTVSLSATGSVSEAGGTIVYTATLTNPAEGAVTVKLSNGQTITIADGQTVGTVEVTVDANEDVYKDASSVSASIESATGGNFENLVVDQTPAVTNITDTIDDTTVSLSATGSVSEAGGTIVYTATLTNPAEGAVTVKLSNGQTITIADGQTVGTVEVTVDANEDVYKDASSVSASIESATGGNFENLVVDQTPAVTNITDTIDDTTVSLSATGSVSEAGGTIVYTATLTNPAEGAVTVKLSNGQTITIADGQTVGTVEVTVDANEDVYKDASSVSASIESATGGNFENLVVDQTPAVTNITDTIDDTTVSLSATGSVSEAGGTIVYTATLTNPAEGAVTVKLSNGQTITIADGQTVGTVEVTVDANEDVYKDASSVSASIESATGGNFENLVVDQTPAVTNITDTIDDTTVSLSATGSVSEAGGTIVYTATLTNPAEGAVTVKLSNGQTITIADGQTVGTVEVTVDANEDVYKDASSVSASIESATGGNFENLVVDQTPAVTNITDTIDDTTVSLSATGSVSEAGGTIVYTATLTNPAEGAVTVKLSNGQTITIADGQTVGTVEVTVDANEDVYKDASSVSASIESATGGNFENLVVDQTPAVTNITDTIDDTTVSLSATGSVSEAGGTIVYTATLTNPAEGAVTVKLSNGQTITIADGQTVGTVEVTVDANEDVYKDASSVSASIESATGGNFENLVVDQTPAVTNITDTIDDTTVSLSATGSVSEAGGTIVYTATLTNPAEGAVTVKLSNGQTITIADGQTVGTVEVTVDANEDVYKDASSVSASIESATGGNFENLVVDQTPAVTNITDTIDTVTVDLSANVTTIAEGVDGDNKPNQITYTATLSGGVAKNDITVTLANGEEIIIKAGESSGSVSVNVQGDDVYKDGETIENRIDTVVEGEGEPQLESLVKADNTNVSVTVEDTVDTTTLTLLGSKVNQGQEATISATLDHAPQTELQVTLSNGAVLIFKTDYVPGTKVTSSTFIAEDDSVITVKSFVGGNFENLDLSSSAVLDVNDKPVAKDFMIKPTSDHGVLINFNNPNGDGGDKISDEEDDAANGGNAALKVIITDLPESGILIYTDLNGVSRAITQADVSKTQFEADRISYQPTDGLGFLLGSKDVPDNSLKEGGFLNWGSQVDADGKVREVKLANGDVITISSDSGPLTQYQNNASHVGHGIGDNDGSGIEAGERISINFSSEPAHQIKVGFDGLGGLFENGDSGAALITLTYSDGTTQQFEVRKPNGVYGDDGLLQEVSYSAPSGLTITQLSFSTLGGGNWELRYVEALPADETFKYQTIDSEGVLSDEATVIVNNSNSDRTPVAEDGHIVTNEDQSYVFEWSDFGVTDVDTLPSSLSVIIDSLPTDGSLTLNGTAIVAGTSVSYEDINVGKLVFTPAVHQSSINSASQDGVVVGNKESDYAKFDFKVSDGVSSSPVESITIDVRPVASGVNVTASFSLMDLNSTTHPAQAILDSVSNRLAEHAGDFVKYTLNAQTAQSDYFLTGSLYNTFGGSGNDVLQHSEGAQIYLDGGEGDDILIGSNGTTTVTSEQLYGGHGSDILIGGASVQGTIDLYGDNTGEVGDDILISRNANNTTSFYGGDGRDIAYLPVAFTDFNVFSGDGHPYDVRLQLKGSSAFQDFYSVEFVYFTDGKYQIIDGSFTKISEFVELNIEASLVDIDGSEEFTDIIITGMPIGTVIPGSQYNEQNGTFTLQVPTDSISENGLSATITLPVELPVNAQLGQVTVKVGSQEIDNAGLPISDSVYGETQTGFVGTAIDPNGDNTVIGGKGDDVLMGDIGGTVTTVVPGKDYNIALVVDTSGSMAGDQNSLVINALKQFVTDLEKHDGKINIALIGFGGRAVVLDSVKDLTDEKLDDLLSKIDTLPASGATNYQDAFIKATDWFNSADVLPKEQNLTFFLTDGEPTTSNNSSNSGGSTQFEDMYDALTAFEVLSAKSTVNAIGIGNGISEKTLSFFDNTSASGEQLQTQMIYLNGISVTDKGTSDNDGEATWAVGQEFTLSENNVAQLSFTIREGAHFGGDDELYWRVEHFVDGRWIIHTHSDNDGRYSVDLLQPGTYRIAVYAYEDQARHTAQVKVEDIQLKVVTASIGNVEIVTQADELDAVLASGNTYIELDSVGSDTVIGNEGNDILFGDAINTDNLPWGVNGNPEKPEGIVDGAGLIGLETFLELKYGSAPSELDIYKFIRDNHDLFDVPGDTRGGNDTLDGGLGNDILYGQGGNDILIGGLGDDILTGGDGADIFKFVDQTGLRDGERDTITDFTAGEDKIDLSDLLHTNQNDSIDSLLESNEIGLTLNGGNLELTISDGSSHQTVVIENGASQYQSYINEGSITNMNAILNDLLKIHDN